MKKFIVACLITCSFASCTTGTQEPTEKIVHSFTLQKGAWLTRVTVTAHKYDSLVSYSGTAAYHVIISK